MNWKKSFLISILVIAVGGSFMALGWSATATDAKKKPGPPPPPPKVFLDGTPWEAVDQVAALKRAHESGEST